MSIPKKLLDEIISLPSSTRSELVEILLDSLDKSDENISEFWKIGDEKHIGDYDSSDIKTLK